MDDYNNTNYSDNESTSSLASVLSFSRAVDTVSFGVKGCSIL